MMKQMKPDIIATIHMYDTRTDNSNLKKKRIPPCQYSCPVFFDDETKGFDCRLLLNQIGKSIGRGETLLDVPIKFLFYDLVKPKLKIGQHFKLWDMGFFGEGTITELL